MDVLSGKTLIRKKGEEFEEVEADEALKDVAVLGLYFSAKWCPPGNLFTPKLAECYKELKEAEKSFEVVFISSDQDEEVFKEYMIESHGDWMAIPFEDQLKHELEIKFNVDGIPMLVIVKQDGQLIADNGRLDVCVLGAKAYEAWAEGKPAVTNPEEFYDSEKDEAEGKDDERKEEEEAKVEINNDDAEEEKGD